MKKKYELYQKILDIENVITVVLDRNADIVLINRKGADILGEAKEKLTGKNWINNFILPQEREGVKKVFNSIISGELEGADYYENYILTASGKTPLIAWHNAYIYDDTGIITHTISSGDDITERRKLEHTLVKKNQELEKTLEELKLTQKRLLQRERMEVVGQLSAGIAHHFNNLLTGIIGNAEILGIDPELYKKHSKELGQIVQASNRAAALVQKMLDFSKQSILKSANSDLTALVKTVAYKFRKSLPDSIALNINIKCGECRTKYDPTKLEQVLTNLISNAKDSIKDKGEIEITLDRVSINKKLVCSMCGGEISGNKLLLRIEDSGSGIPKDIVPHIFEPFFTTRGFGKGLGLSQVFGIIEQLNGHLTIEDREKGGTIINVFLPYPEPTFM